MSIVYLDYNVAEAQCSGDPSELEKVGDGVQDNQTQGDHAVAHHCDQEALEIE